MALIPCSGSVQLSPPHTKYLGMETKDVSAKNRKISLNQQKLSRERERDIQAWCHTLSRPSPTVSTTYRILEHGKHRNLCQRWKMCSKSAKIAQRKEKTSKY